MEFIYFIQSTASRKFHLDIFPENKDKNRSRIQSISREITAPQSFALS
jgi:hypothetical protein